MQYLLCMDMPTLTQKFWLSQMDEIKYICVFLFEIFLDSYDDKYYMAGYFGKIQEGSSQLRILISIRSQLNPTCIYRKEQAYMAKPILARASSNSHTIHRIQYKFIQYIWTKAGQVVKVASESQRYFPRIHVRVSIATTRYDTYWKTITWLFFC